MDKVIDEVTKEQLIADFKTVVADAEALLKATANHGGEELAGVRAKAEESIRAVKARIADEQTSFAARDARIISSASPPLDASFPKKKIIMALALVLAVPLFLFVRHWLGAYEVDEEMNLLAGLGALWGSIFTVFSFLTTTGFEADGWAVFGD